MLRSNGRYIGGTQGILRSCSAVIAVRRFLTKRSSFRSAVTSAYRVINQTEVLSGRVVGYTGSDLCKRARNVKGSRLNSALTILGSDLSLMPYLFLLIFLDVQQFRGALSDTKD